MKKIFLISFWVFITAVSFGQDSLISPRENYKYAMLFSARLLSLDPFHESMIALKYNPNPSSAFRLALSLTGDFDIEAAVNDKDTTKPESLNFNIYLTRLFYNSLAEDISYYWGIGPYFNRNFKTEIYPSTSNKWELGLAVCFGAEWTISQWISLEAEYGIQVGWKKEQISQPNSTVLITKSWSVSTYNPLHVGVSFYFQRKAK